MLSDTHEVTHLIKVRVSVGIQVCYDCPACSQPPSVSALLLAATSSISVQLLAVQVPAPRHSALPASPRSPRTYEQFLSFFCSIWRERFHLFIELHDTFWSWFSSAFLKGLSHFLGQRLFPLLPTTLEFVHVSLSLGNLILPCGLHSSLPRRSYTLTDVLGLKQVPTTCWVLPQGLPSGVLQ